MLNFTQRQQLLYADVIERNAAGSSPNDSMGDFDHEIHVSESRQEDAHDLDSDWDDEEEIGLSTLPPGEEGFYNSHQGGEAILNNLVDDMTSR